MHNTKILVIVALITITTAFDPNLISLVEISKASSFVPYLVPRFPNTAGTVNNNDGFVVPSIPGSTCHFPTGCGTVTLHYPTLYLIGNFTGGGMQVISHSNLNGQWELGRINNNAIFWSSLGRTGFGDLLDGKHWITTGDFNGDGRTDILFHYIGDGNWWLGTYANNTLNWTYVGNSEGHNSSPINFGNLLDNRHLILTGDFNGDGRTDILFHYDGDGNWFIGSINNNQLQWSNAGNTRGFGSNVNFGSLMNRDHAITAFTTDRTYVLFTSSDGNWWLGTYANNTLNWTYVGNIGNLLNPPYMMIMGKFHSPVEQNILIYDSIRGTWTMGTIHGNSPIDWTFMGRAAFGDLLDGKHWITTGDFNGDGRTDILFHYDGDGNWWLGQITTNTINWINIGSVFRDLLDAHHELFNGKFQGNSEQILLHDEFSTNYWWLGNLLPTNRLNIIQLQQLGVIVTP